MPTPDQPVIDASTVSRGFSRRCAVQWLLLAAGLLLAGSALGAEPVSISGAWVRLLPVDVPLAGYFTMHNHGKTPVKLTGASSPAFQRIELHHSMTMK